VLTHELRQAWSRLSFDVRQKYENIPDQDYLERLARIVRVLRNSNNMDYSLRIPVFKERGIRPN